MVPDPVKMTAVVHEYMAAFDSGSLDRIMALYAENATLEDPVGTTLHQSLPAIRAFYLEALQTGAKLRLDGPVRVTAGYAVFPFSVNLEHEGARTEIHVIDCFQFDEAHRITAMQAFWGPSNVQTFKG